MIEFESFVAQTAVDAFLILRLGTADASVVPATAATDLLIGTSCSLPKDAGEMVDMDVRPVAEVRLGGNITRGQPITANASSRGVLAAPAAGANVRIIGFALRSGVNGDVIPYLRAPGVVQG